MEKKKPHRESRSELRRASGSIHSLALSRTPPGGFSALGGLIAVLVGKRCHLQSGMQGSVFFKATKPYSSAWGGVTNQ